MAGRSEFSLLLAGGRSGSDRRDYDIDGQHGPGGGHPDEESAAYADGPDPDPEALDGLSREWGVTGRDRFQAYLYPTYLYRWFKVLGLQFRPRALPLFAGLQIIQPTYRLIMVRGMATRLIGWLKEFGINAYHCEHASPGRLDLFWSGQFLNHEAAPTLLFANWNWLSRYVVWSDYGRNWLDRFHVVAGGVFPRFMRVHNRWDAAWVKEQMPKPMDVRLGPTPPAVVRGWHRSKFSSLHRRTEEERRRDLCSVLCRLVGVATPRPIDWTIADYLMHWSESRFYSILDRIVRERVVLSTLEAGRLGE